MTHHHEVAFEMIVVDFAHGVHFGEKSEVGAEQFERRSRGYGLHGRSRDKRLMRCIGGNHRAGVEAEHTHAHRGIFENILIDKSVDRALKIVGYNGHSRGCSQGDSE